MTNFRCADNSLQNIEKKYKNKIHSFIKQRGLCSIMNNTKWRELIKGVECLSFSPPYKIKTVDEMETLNHQFEIDVYYEGDWGIDVENCLGELSVVPFYAIEWIKIRPRILKKQGPLLENSVIDETEAFLAILKKYNIPFKVQNGTYLIYGYK